MQLGHSLTPDHLRLMFTPDFGMFIAPGCNGIRGSITMGFVALITGYVYRFRWYANALVVAGAILLGYVFNLARLCLLVLYYMVALHFPSLQDKAKNADYLIGATLFLIATLLLFTVINRLRGTADRDVQAAETERDVLPSRKLHVKHGQLAAMGAVVLLGCVGVARAFAVSNPFAPPVVDVSALHFPDRLGDYALVHTWEEGPPVAPVVYVWAEYTPSGGGTPIAIGVSPAPDWHDPVLCHSVRGENPAWHGQLEVATAGVVPISFTSALYNNGVTQYIEASTLCRDGSCGEYPDPARSLWICLYPR